MSDAYPIKDLIESAGKFHCIRNKDEYARYRSWEHCNKAFNEKHEKRKKGSDLSEDDYDYLALHLSFYLASWGMLRPSSMLILTDYKVHIPIVEEIMKEEYDALWNITYENLNNEKENIRGLIIKIQKELYSDRTKFVKEEYGKTGNISDTLATKILLGTLACIPAYDTYFTDVVTAYGIAEKKPNIESIEALAKFYEDNEDELNKLLREFEKDGVRYPQMKILDMMFFQYGMDNF